MSTPVVSSSVPWITRAKAPIRTYATRRRSRAARIASGSKRSSAGTLGLQPTQHPGNALLGRQLRRLVDGGHVNRLVRHQVEGQVEAASLQQLDEGVEAGGHRVSLPAGDLGAVLADPVAELRLAQPGAQARLADEAAAQRHGRAAIDIDMLRETVPIREAGLLPRPKSTGGLAPTARARGLLRVVSVRLLPMRITSKGQVTIPIEIREQLGLLPGTEVTFEVDGDGVRLIRSDRAAGRGRTIV